MTRNQRDIANERGSWSVSNNSWDRSINADGAIAEIGDGLCTLIQDLKALGILAGDDIA